MMTKKMKVLVALLMSAIVYGGSAWYLGAQTQTQLEQWITDAQATWGSSAKISYDYDRGFFGSSMAVAIEWSEPVESSKTNLDVASKKNPENKTIKISTHSVIHHGPFANFHWAAAAVDTEIKHVDGLSDDASKWFRQHKKAGLKTLLTFSGGQDFVLTIPSGEKMVSVGNIMWGDLEARWMMAGDKTNMVMNLDVPVFKMDFAPLGTVASLVENPKKSGFGHSLSLKNTVLHADFHPERGVWLFAPGSINGSIQSMIMTKIGESQPDKTLVHLTDMTYRGEIEQHEQQLTMASQFNAKGMIGSIKLDPLSYSGNLKRLSVDAIEQLQKSLVIAYFSPKDEAVPAFHDLTDDPKAQASLKNFFAALPSYEVEWTASRQAEKAQATYQLQLVSQPDADMMKNVGVLEALMKAIAMDMHVKLPKAWLPEVAQWWMEQRPDEHQIKAMLDAGHAQGWLVQDANSISSQARLASGKVLVNDKDMGKPALN